MSMYSSEDSIAQTRSEIESGDRSLRILKQHGNCDSELYESWRAGPVGKIILCARERPTASS